MRLQCGKRGSSGCRVLICFREVIQYKSPEREPPATAIMQARYLSGLYDLHALGLQLRKQASQVGMDRAEPPFALRSCEPRPGSPLPAGAFFTSGTAPVCAPRNRDLLLTRPPLFAWHDHCTSGGSYEEARPF